MRCRDLGLLVILSTLAASASAQAPPATITTLDSNGDVGRHSAVAYGPGGLAVVSYHDVTNGDIKVAVCQNAACTSAVLRVVDDSGTASGHTSIAIPADGRALIAYQAGPVIRLARCGDPSCATATSVVVESVTAPAPGTAIGIGGDGLAVVAYANAANVQPRIAHCEDADCSTRTITPYPLHGSRNVSLTIGGDGLALFTFDTGTAVYVGHCTNASCTAATFNIITYPAPNPTFTNASLATGTDGYGVVAVTRETTSAGGSLVETEIRRCYDASCLNLSVQGSVGTELIDPAIDVTAADHPRVVHYGGASPQRLQVTRCPATACGSPQPFPPTYPIEAPGIGQSPAFAIGPDDVGLVSYYDEASADLKVAHLLGGPELTIGDAGVGEGNSGLTPILFEVTLSQAANATVDYATQSGGAAAGLDFVATSGTLTFAPGSLTQTVTVGVIGDLVPEDAMEQFSVLLSNPQNAFLVDERGNGRIFDDDIAAAAATAELGHGVTREDDLAAGPGPVADVDLFRVAQAPFAAYEVVADALSGDLLPFDLRLVESDGLTTVEASTPVGSGAARSLRWLASDGPVLNQLVRVSGGCARFCGSDDVYRLRMYETTLRGARFNNAGSQTTVLLLQNPTGAAVTVVVQFWAPNGERLGTYDSRLVGPLPPRGLLVIPTSQVPGAAGKSGTLTVAHDAPFGALVGKTVALEPASGFSFDTPLEPRRR